MKTNNIEHLEWIYNRMIQVNKENPNIDYMIRFNDIIRSLSENSNENKIRNKHGIHRTIIPKELVNFNYRNLENFDTIYIKNKPYLSKLVYMEHENGYRIVSTRGDLFFKEKELQEEWILNT